MAIRAVTISPKSSGMVSSGGGLKKAVFGLGIGKPQPMGSDLTPHYLAATGGVFDGAKAQAKVPGSAPLLIDVLISKDEGHTWNSIFPPDDPDKLVIPTGSTDMVEVTTFADAPNNTIAENDWLRIDLLAPSAEDAQDITVVITWGTEGESGSGIPGPPGPKGDKGDPGDPGGLPGPAGAQGAKGEKGDPGPVGPAGPRGFTGAQGLKGDKGDTGPQGIQGIQGIKGDKGDKGDTGSQGVKGDPGNLIWRGTYDAGVTYSLEDVVSYGGKTYVSKANSNVGNQPDVSPAKWDVMLEGGGGSAGTAYPTPPALNLWTWVNQGTATADHNGQYITLRAMNQGVADNFKILDMAAPATPYYVDSAIRTDAKNTNYNNCGVLMRNSGTGQMYTLQWCWENAMVFHIRKWNSPTSYNSEYTAPPAPAFGQVLWFRLMDDGVNRSISYSADHQHWIQLHSVARADFMTPDRIAWFSNAVESNFPVDTFLLGFVLTQAAQPDNTPYMFAAAQGSAGPAGPQGLPGTGGGANCSIGLYSALPASGVNVGDTHKCSDSGYKFVWSGSVWVPFWRDEPVVIPPITGWGWIGSTYGNEVSDQASGMLNLSFSLDAAHSQFRCYGRALPAPPFTVTMLLSTAFGGSDDTLVGVWIGKSADSTGYAYMLRAWLPVIMYSVTAGNNNYANPYDPARGRWLPQPIWFRFKDDGAHQYVYWSPDGVHWILDNHFSLATNYCNRIAVGGNGLSCSSSISLLSYQVTTP